MSIRYLVYGAGGLGIEVIDIMQRSNVDRSTICFVDDFHAGETIYGLPVIDFDHAIRSHAKAKVVIAQGEPSARKALYEKVKERSFVLETLIDPTATVSPTAALEEGAIVCPYCLIAAKAKVGKNVLVNARSILGHEVITGDHVVISSMVNFGGGCQIDDGSFVGMGALIKEKVSIGKNSIVSMASAVYRDVGDEVVVVGNPARVARKNTENKIFN